MRLPFLVIAATLPALILSASADAKDKKPQDPNKKVCRSEIPTGSMMAKSTCHTAAQWQTIDQENHDASESAMSRASSGTGHN